MNGNQTMIRFGYVQCTVPVLYRMARCFIVHAICRRFVSLHSRLFECYKLSFDWAFIRIHWLLFCTQSQKYVIESHWQRMFASIGTVINFGVKKSLSLLAALSGDRHLK